MPISDDMVVWPGHEAPNLQWTRRFEDGHRSISSVLMTNVHNGTHIDAPLHFTPGGATIEQLPLEPFIGNATVVDIPDVDAITAADLNRCVPAGTERLLLRTRNSFERTSAFNTAFVGLTVDAAHWIVDAGIRLVGNDYPSIAVYKGDAEIHLALMRAGVGILEGIVLDNVEPGEYQLICLPVLIKGAEGAPARAVIRRRPD